MKFSTDKPHRDYFYKHGTIEFDALFTSDQIHELNKAIDHILCQKLSIASSQLPRQESNDLFLQGRDLFRQEDSIKKLVLHRRLAEIAVELTEARSLRIGYDQLLPGEPKPPYIDTAYNQFLMNPGTLQDKSCLIPVICGLIICLEPSPDEEAPSPLFSKTPGNGIFFKADLPMDLSNLTQSPGGRYLLITYVDPRTVYVFNEKDPHTHHLKHIGYVFGDRLSDKLNPLIYR
jgi:hypothetical protein